jgi:hypothetical protein
VQRESRGAGTSPQKPNRFVAAVRRSRMRAQFVLCLGALSRAPVHMLAAPLNAYGEIVERSEHEPRDVSHRLHDAPKVAPVRQSCRIQCVAACRRAQFIRPSLSLAGRMLSESQRVRSMTFLVERSRVTSTVAGPARGVPSMGLIAKDCGR